MSYSRDKDAYTRGPGAIAAADYGNARRAHERRMIQRRSGVRDRALAEYTLGPRGGIGAIPLPSAGGVRTGIRTGGNVESPGGGLVPQVGSGRGGGSVTFPAGGGGGTSSTPNWLQTLKGMIPSGMLAQDFTPVATEPSRTTVGIVLCPDGTRRPLMPDGTNPCPPAPVPSTAETPWYYRYGMSPRLYGLAALAAVGGYYYYKRSKRGGAG